MLPVEFKLDLFNQDFLAFCNDLETNQTSFYANCIPIDSRYRPDECYENVKNYTKEHGGSIVYGWHIYKVADLFLEAQFHAIVKKGNDYLEVSPQPDGCSMITFLPSNNKYEGRHIGSRFRQIKANTFVENYIIDAIKENKIYEEYSIGETKLHLPSSVENELKLIINRRIYLINKINRQLNKDLAK